MKSTKKLWTEKFSISLSIKLLWFRSFLRLRPLKIQKMNFKIINLKIELLDIERFQMKLSQLQSFISLHSSSTVFGLDHFSI